MSKRRGRSFHAEGLKTQKSREPTVEGLVRGIWRMRISLKSRADNTGRCVKLKTITEIRRSSARDIFVVENVYRVMNIFSH